MKRLVPAGLLAVACVLLAAAPAAAHGGGGSDATNFESTITDGPDDDLRWHVIAGDALLELENRSGRDVVILGYQGEPYLRFGGDGGVFENRRSPATYLNQDRYARTEVPGDVDADAEPEWRRVVDGSTHAWHDHRIHWMSPEKPPMVKSNPGETVEVQQWTVPYLLDGDQAELAGVLRYVPAPAWWPWVLGAVGLLLLPALVAVVVASGRLTLRRLARTGAVLVVVLGLVDAVHQIDDLVAVPATMGENVAAGLYGGFFILGALIAAWRAWRTASAIPLVFAGLLLLFSFGISHTSALTSSQLMSELPDGFTRAVVAANLAVVLPLAVLVLAAERRFPVHRAKVVARRTGDEPER